MALKWKRKTYASFFEVKKPSFNFPPIRSKGTHSFWVFLYPPISIVTLACTALHHFKSLLPLSFFSKIPILKTMILWKKAEIKVFTLIDPSFFLSLPSLGFCFSFFVSPERTNTLGFLSFLTCFLFILLVYLVLYSRKQEI